LLFELLRSELKNDRSLRKKKLERKKKSGRKNRKGWKNLSRKSKNDWKKNT
jgi:hypothetical protein